MISQHRTSLTDIAICRPPVSDAEWCAVATDVWLSNGAGRLVRNFYSTQGILFSYL